MDEKYILEQYKSGRTIKDISKELHVALFPIA